MDAKVCVNCLNKKVINSTTNRLVTESCGHVKCMDCLLNEKAGCVACAGDSPKEPEDSPEPSEGPPSDAGNGEHDPVHTEFPLKHFILEGDTEKVVQTDYYCDKKKKLETSHIRIETDGNVRSYFCTVCKKKFQARSQVAYHAYCNGQRKPYQCPECSKSFATHSHFKYHMRVHRNERTYACELCGEGFFQMSKLQRHKLKHTKEKKYQCTECSKAFNNLTSLRKHGLTHSEERPYGCGTCGRRFRDSSNYRKHVAKHAAEHDGGCARACACGACGRRRARAYQCPRCPQAFHARKDMRRHAAVHTDSKPFRCKVCSRRFRRKDNLERHIRNTHPEHAPASAVLRDSPEQPQDYSAKPPPDDTYEIKEKSILESLNPLPPLPPEAIQKHLEEDVKEKFATQKILDAPKHLKEDVKDNPKMEKILEGNTAQKQLQKATHLEENVKEKSPTEILEARKLLQDDVNEKSLAEKILEANNARRSVIFGPVRACAREEPVEYVHKIRRAREPILPPVDETKLHMLKKLANQNELDVGAPPEKFRELYKKILYERSAAEREQQPQEDVHWRKKMKLATNWSIFNYMKG